MITITVEAYGAFDESTEKFISIDQSVKLHMENSLFAIAEWEKKYKKPWFPDSRASESVKKKQSEKTQEEMFYFIKCMITHIDGKKVLCVEDVDDKILYGFKEKDYQKITEYLQDSQTALTHIPETKESKKKKTDSIKMTSDRIYAWIAELQMPIECEYWNINRLMNVIQVINYDNTPDDKKKTQRPYEVAQDYARINEERLKRLGKKG